MDIEKRLARVERQCRLYRNLFVLAGLVLVASLAYGATDPIPDVIRARKLQILNEKGVAVVGLASMPEGGGAVIVLSKNGTPAVTVSTIPNNGAGALAIYSSGGKSRINLFGSAPADISGSIMVRNKYGKKIVLIGGNPDNGNGLIGLFDRDGRAKSAASFK